MSSKQTTNMDSPKPSFNEDTPPSYAAGDNVRLMEDFTVDPRPLNDTTPPPIALLFKPEYRITYNSLTVARIAILLLSISAGVFLLFGRFNSSDLTLLIFTFAPSLINVFFTVLTLIFHLTQRWADREARSGA
jgi:hypothetical protein